MKNPVSDKKQDLGNEVAGVNRRNLQVSPEDTKPVKNQRGSDLKDRKNNSRSKTMIDGAEGESV